MAASDRRYLILLNDALKTHLARLPQAQQRRFREKIEFLMNGMWDAGVRVKKLRGTSKVVFEARLSRGERLLFTLGRYREAVAVYLWGLASHDEVSAHARRIVPANAPFLDFQEVGHEDQAELNLDAIPSPYFTQENVEEQVPEDYGPQRWLVFDEAEWERLLAFSDPSSFEGFLHLTREQEELLASPPPVLLSGTAGSGKTTLSVYYLLRGARADGRRLFVTYNPLLKRLARSIYTGLSEKRVARADGAPPRFALFREMALEIAGGPEAGFRPESEVGLAEFSAILSDFREGARLDVELAWEEIRSVVKGATIPLDPKRCSALVKRFVDGSASTREKCELLDYLAGLRNLGVGRKCEAAIARRSLFRDWDELLAALARQNAASSPDCRVALGMVGELVSKHPGDFTRPLLALDDYLALGRKRAPNFRHDRSVLHAAAVYYQERLERSRRWDEIDLARAALRRLDGAQAAAPAWDLVVCDEVQDLADVQIALLFRLAADPRSIVLTGDPRQILNPTGFRWEEVKYRFRERGLPVPEVKRLSLNFRCVGPIVRLANTLLDLKASLVGLSDTETKEQWKFGGRPPIVLEGVTEETLLRLLSRRGAGQVILTRTVAEAARLRKELATEMVFTIAEAKGLEFDAVLLWKFADTRESEPIWRAIAAGSGLDEDRVPHVRHELALLYVAVTRARSTLLAWDGERVASVWDAPGVPPCVFRTGEVDRAAELWKTASTPAEWEAQGDYFLDRGNQRAARECYRNAGAVAKHELATAYVLEQEGSHAEAARLFARHGEPARSAECWEKAADWGRAEETWRSLGEHRRARVCAAHGAEARGALADAALAWEALGERERAESLWRRTGAFDRLAQAALAAGDNARAAGLFEKARMGREAAAAWERARDWDKAGELWLRLGDHAAAARMFRRSRNDEKLLRCLRQLGEHRQVALLLEKRGELEKAVEAFAAAAAVSEDERRLIEEEIPEPRTKRTMKKAAVRLAALGREAEAAPLFFDAGAIDAAARRYERLGDHAGLAHCHEAGRRWLQAARELALEDPPKDGPRQSAAIQNLLYRHIRASRGPEHEQREIDALLREADQLLAQGRLIPALARYRLFGNTEAVGGISRRLGWHEDAIEWMIASGNTASALLYAREGGFPVPAAMLESLLARHLEDSKRSERAFNEVRETFVHLLVACVGSLAAEEAVARVEDFFQRSYGPFPDIDLIPDAGLALLLDTRATRPLIDLLDCELRFSRRPKGRLQELLVRLGKAAETTQDPRIVACDQFARTRLGTADREAFERSVEGLPLSPATAHILGRSRKRYREAVELLMAQGSGDEAELYCRINHDLQLAAACAQKRGNFRDALRYFRDAKDTEGALRAALASGDERQVARVREWRGEFAEALKIWKKLGRAGDVQRLLRKRPLLR